jgi:TetR/AcrR family transcriptional regulator
MVRRSMKQSVSVRQKTAVPRPGARGRPLKRTEQQRAVETRLAILKAALAEFAEKGFDAASIRAIAKRTGLQHPLITYHFRNKDILWRATAEYAFGQIREAWDGLEETNVGMSALDRLRSEYRTLFRYTAAFPEFHRFMRQECTTNNPRLRWVAKTVVVPLINRLLPQIASLQNAKQLPPMEPIVFHYMMVSLTAMLAEFGPEMAVTSKLAADDPRVVKGYWQAVDKMIFGKSVRLLSTEIAKDRAGF